MHSRSSDDDAELQEVVQEACSGRKSLTWEEALKVAETLSRHHSHEDLIESEAYGYRQNRSGIKYRRLTGDEDSNTDTDTEVEAGKLSFYILNTVHTCLLKSSTFFKLVSIWL